MRSVFLLLLFLAACSDPQSTGDAPADTPYLAQPEHVRLGMIPTAAEIVFHREGLIYVMDRSGRNVVQITFERPRQWEHVAVSHDRKHVVANEQLPNPEGEPGGFSRLWLFDLQAGTQARLLPGFVTAGNGGVDWDREGFVYVAAKETNVVTNPGSPDDFRANAGANDVYRIKRDGTGLRRLLDTPDAGEADVSVSEDGSLVAYVSQPVSSSADHTEIWVMKSDGTNPYRVYKAGRTGVASAHDPELSPDNTKVIFSIVNSSVPPNFPGNPAANTAHDIWSINVDGTGLKRLTRPGPISIIPDWKGALIVFLDISETDRYAGASIVNPDEGEQVPHRIGSGPNSPKWIPE